MPFKTPTIEDIQGLAAEVRALVAAGLPLESHLADAGRGHGVRLQTLTQQISDRLNQGQTLSEAIAPAAGGASRMLSAAVAAGIQSGDLAASVEMLGDMAADVAELRRRILHALAYPLTVLAVAVVLFVVFVSEFLVQIRALFADLRIPVSPWLQTVVAWDRDYPWWPWAVPAIAAVTLIVWLISGRAGSLSFRGPERLLTCFPGVSGMVRDLQFYTLTRMLALLVDRQVPLPEALVLAGASSGSIILDRACQAAAKQVSDGNLPTLARQEFWSQGKLPPLLHTALCHAGEQEDRLRLRLSGVAAHYHRRLQISVAWLRNVIPVTMFVIIGGGTVVLYGLTVFWPVTELYRRLGG